MKKLILSILIVLLILSLASISSCTKEQQKESVARVVNKSATSTPNVTEQDYITVVNSTEATNLINSQFLLVDKINLAIQNGNSIESIKNEAIKYARGESNSFNTIVFGNNEAASQYINNLTQARNDFHERFAYLNLNADVTANCTSCSAVTLEDQVNLFFNNYGTFNDLRSSGIYFGDTDPDPQVNKMICGSSQNQALLLTCVAVCGGTTAGLGAVFCGWGCWCTFCPRNSALSESICANMTAEAWGWFVASRAYLQTF